MTPINPAASNDDATPTGGETTPASEPQVVEVTETFTTTTPQMPDLPPAPKCGRPAAHHRDAGLLRPHGPAECDRCAAVRPAGIQPHHAAGRRSVRAARGGPVCAAYGRSVRAAVQPAVRPAAIRPSRPGTPAYAPVPAGYVPRNKILAGLLALFFGALGIHNFYLGFTGKAIAQVLLTCLGWILFGLGPLAAIVWSIVEGVQILTSDYGAPAHRDARGVELVD